MNVDSSKQLAAYYYVTAVPTFKVDAQGKPIAEITSAKRGENVPVEIEPVMVKLVSTATYDLKK